MLLPLPNNPWTKYQAGTDSDDSDYFQVAPWISPSARSLLEDMLESDPKKRYSMGEVRSHPWFTQTPGDSGRCDDTTMLRKIGNDSGGDLRNNRSSSCSSRSSSSTAAAEAALKALRGQGKASEGLLPSID